jgi:hypothetical protein
MKTFASDDNAHKEDNVRPLIAEPTDKEKTQLAGGSGVPGTGGDLDDRASAVSGVGEPHLDEPGEHSET